MDTEELKILFQKSDKVPYEEKFNKEITFEDISLKKVNAILNEAKMSVIDISIKDICIKHPTLKKQIKLETSMPERFKNFWMLAAQTYPEQVQFH